MNKKISSKEKSKLKYSQINNSNKIKTLMVIDNKPLIKKEIKEINSCFRKIDKFEQTFLRFEQTDKKLFQEWHDLTFRKIYEEINKNKNLFHKLAEFKNFVIYLTDVDKKSYKQALEILNNEDLILEKGSEADKESIRNIRIERHKHIHEEMNKYNYFDDEDDVDEDNFFNNSTEIDDEGSESRNNFKSKNGNNDKIESILKLSSDELKRKFSSAKFNLDEFLDIYESLARTHNYDKLREIIKYLPKIQKKILDTLFELQTGFELDKLTLFLEKQYKNNLNHVSENEFNETENQSQSKYSHDKYHHDNSNISKSLNEDETIELTSIYRKIVRKIHPDHISQEILNKRKIWFDQIWKNAQEAKNKKNLFALQIIYHKILASFQEFEELSLFELSTMNKNLNYEFNQMKKISKDTRKHPAWKFSEKKDYASLKFKLEQPLIDEIMYLKEEIEELKLFKKYIESEAKQKRNHKR